MWFTYSNDLDTQKREKEEFFIIFIHHRRRVNKHSHFQHTESFICPHMSKKEKFFLTKTLIRHFGYLVDKDLAIRHSQDVIQCTPKKNYGTCNNQNVRDTICLPLCLIYSSLMLHMHMHVTNMHSDRKKTWAICYVSCVALCIKEWSKRRARGNSHNSIVLL